MTTSPLFLVPMRSEALAVRLGAPGVQRRCIGMGPARATRAGRDLVREIDADRPIALLGVCGGLRPGLRSGDVVVASSISLLSSKDAIVMPGANDVARTLEKSGRRVEIAPMVSSPTILRGDDSRQLAGSDGAIAVDMESYWCASLVRDNPFVVVRVVLDTFGDRLVSPRTAHAAVRSFHSLYRVARSLATNFPALSSTNSFEKIGES